MFNIIAGLASISQLLLQSAPLFIDTTIVFGLMKLISAILAYGMLLTLVGIIIPSFLHDMQPQHKHPHVNTLPPDQPYNCNAHT